MRYRELLLATLLLVGAGCSGSQDEDGSLGDGDPDPSSTSAPSSSVVPPNTAAPSTTGPQPPSGQGSVPVELTTTSPAAVGMTVLAGAGDELLGTRDGPIAFVEPDTDGAPTGVIVVVSPDGEEYGRHDLGSPVVSMTAQPGWPHQVIARFGDGRPPAVVDTRTGVVNDIPDGVFRHGPSRVGAPLVVEDLNDRTRTLVGPNGVVDLEAVLGSGWVPVEGAGQRVMLFHLGDALGVIDALALARVGNNGVVVERRFDIDPEHVLHAASQGCDGSCVVFALGSRQGQAGVVEIWHEADGLSALSIADLADQTFTALSVDARTVAIATTTDMMLIDTETTEASGWFTADRVVSWLGGGVIVTRDRETVLHQVTGTAPLAELDDSYAPATNPLLSHTTTGDRYRWLADQNGTRNDTDIHVIDSQTGSVRSWRESPVGDTVDDYFFAVQDIGVDRHGRAYVPTGESLWLLDPDGTWDAVLSDVRTAPMLAPESGRMVVTRRPAFDHFEVLLVDRDGTVLRELGSGLNAVWMYG